MRAIRRTISTAALFAALCLPASGETLGLSPADPQPDAAALTQGLAVSYAYPPEVGSLQQAKDWLDDARPGPPLSGLRYIDTAKGEVALTSRQETRVVAEISGYVRFERAGAHKIEFYSNDGLLVEIGGREVSRYDGRHPCESGGYQDVTVPEPGWYEIKALYFQRLGTSCLLMKWDADSGKPGWAADEAFAYLK
ncbi:hypothetical protein [Pikeienuella sp. HZG-20]|uniref:hypothetical protein n=1 Tax=Paludibacillus litoralis TaxID=3133267 RepID=UPI0030EF1C45